MTKSAKSLQIADGSKDGSLKSSPGSRSSTLACSQAASAGNKDRFHTSGSSSGSISSMPECSQAAAAAAATNGVCIV